MLVEAWVQIGSMGQKLQLAVEIPNAEFAGLADEDVYGLVDDRVLRLVNWGWREVDGPYLNKRSERAARRLEDGSR